MADYSARQVQLILQPENLPSVDLHEAVLSYSIVGTDSWDTTGVIKANLTVVVGDIDLLPISIDPTLDPLYWHTGVKAALSIRNSTDTAWIRHRTLYVIETTYDDGLKPMGEVSGAPTLTVKLGCIFTLKDSRYPAQMDAKIPVLEPVPDVNLLVPVNYWLEWAKLPQITTLPGDPVITERVIFALPYTANSSIVEHIGQILFWHGGYALWSDATGRSRLCKPTVTPTNWTFEPEAKDIAINTRTGGEREKVAGTVRVMGVSNFVTPAPAVTETDTSVTTGVLTRTETTRVERTGLTVTTTKTGVDTITGLEATSGGGGGSGGTTSNLGNLGEYREVVVETYGGGLPETPNPNPFLPPIPGLSAHLQSEVTTIYEQRPTTGNNLGPQAATKEITKTPYYRTTYALTQGIVVTGIEIRKLVEETKILKEGATGLTTDTIVTEDWVYRGPGQYTYSKTIVRPEETDNRREPFTSSSPGVSIPPGVQWIPSATNTQQVEIYGEAKFTYPIGAPDNDHPRTYNAEFYLPSNDVAEQLAELLGTLLIGRSQSQTIAIVPTDEWLADPVPMPTALVPDPRNPNILVSCLLDAVGISLDKRRCWLGATGIRLGTKVGNNPVTPPYEIPRVRWVTEDGDRVVTEDGDLVRL